MIRVSKFFSISRQRQRKIRIH